MSLQNTPPTDERRQYFRIKNSLFMSYEIIDSTSYEQIPNDQQADSPSLRVLKELNEIERQNKAFLNTLQADQTTIETYISQLNSKITSLSQYLVKNMDIKYKELLEVDLSGGGIRFESESQLNKDQELKLEIVLVPEYHNMIIYGKVINSQQKSDGTEFEHSVVFCQIQEPDRDAIIKHVFKTQSKQLRSDKENLNQD